MWQWFIKNTNEVGVAFTVFSFSLSLAALAFAAWRYVSVRRDELRNIRYEKYHQLFRNISLGADSGGRLKLVSQRAYIYELRHFPEYGNLTVRLLESLLSEWKEDPEVSSKLTYEIQETIHHLNSIKKWRLGY